MLAKSQPVGLRRKRWLMGTHMVAVRRFALCFNIRDQLLQTANRNNLVSCPTE